MDHRRKFLMDFKGEEDDPMADELTPEQLSGIRARPHGPPGKKKKKLYGAAVAFTVDDMYELVRTPRAHREGKWRRGRNDLLEHLYPNTPHEHVNYRLFGNIIAVLFVPDNRLYLTDAGWQTKTTHDRLATLMINEGIPYQIRQERYQWWLYPAPYWGHLVGRYPPPGPFREEWKGNKTFQLIRDGRLP